MASESVASDNDNDSVAMSAAAGVSVSASGKVNVNVASNEKSTSLRSIGGNIVNAITNANASITASIRSTNTDMDSLAQILDSDSDGEEDNDNATICTDIQEAESVKEGEIQPTDCLTPQRHARGIGVWHLYHFRGAIFMDWDWEGVAGVTVSLLTLILLWKKRRKMMMLCPFNNDIGMGWNNVLSS